MLKLMEHQTKALEETANNNHVAYYFDMGLGKTFIGAEKLSILKSEWNLVVCQKSKADDWEEHFKTYYPKMIVHNATQKSVTIKTNPLEVVTKNGEVLSGTPNMKVLIINYELLWRRPYFSFLPNITLLLDESSLIQNDKSKQTKFILELKPENVILLSGTPCSGKYENLWSQAQLLGWDISHEAYDHTYVNWELLDIGMKIVRTVSKKEPYKNVERLKKKLREHGALFLKTEEVLDLPEQVETVIKVEPDAVYNQFRKTKVIKYKGKEYVGENPLTFRLYLRELASIPSVEKQGALVDLLNSTNERLIVFYNWKDELEVLTNLTGRPISVINGEKKDLRAYEKEDDSVTFVQYQAGSMGLNLQKASRMVFFSLPERSDLFEQAKKRIHRIGQKSTCFYYYLISKGTIEESIYKALQQKRDYTNELFKEEFHVHMS